LIISTPATTAITPIFITTPNTITASNSFFVFLFGLCAAISIFSSIGYLIAIWRIDYIISRDLPTNIASKEEMQNLPIENQIK
jgi:hypothetical protein